MAQIEEAYDSNDVEPLHRDNAERQTEKLAIPRRGKRKNRGDEHDRGFDSVAPCLDGDREAVAGAPQDLALGDDLRIEKLDEIRRDRRQCISPRNDKPLLYPGSQLEAEKPRLQHQKPDEESDHGAAILRECRSELRRDARHSTAGQSGRKVVFDAAEDRLGKALLLTLAPQFHLFLGIGDECGLDQDRRDVGRL